MPKWKSRRWEALNIIRKQAHEQNNSANHLPLSHNPPFSDVYHFLFFHVVFLSYSFWSALPCPHLLKMKSFFLSTLHFSHSVYLSVSRSVLLSGYPLLFYNSQCNGLNVKNKSLPPPSKSLISLLLELVILPALSQASTLVIVFADC